MALIELTVVALDCPDPRALAGFYAELLDWRVTGEGDWFEAVGPQGRRLAFQEVAGYRPPQWPGQDRPQQCHLDFDVRRADLEAAQEKALALGAKLVQQDDARQSWRVYLDPVGHPFCLCLCD
ncbi:VOC family protein [Streptomyces catenulae]|uniref:VOC family protein n=1 Tax=Streptomyces catenulae TaxID=66875 RepID=A0ABV2Z2V8_9ACTN|nr:VOC family protein [Streptomyces catenulae]